MKNQPSPRLWPGERPSAAFPSSFVNDVPSGTISGALHLDIFDQPELTESFNPSLSSIPHLLLTPSYHPSSIDPSRISSGIQPWEFAQLSQVANPGLTRREDDQGR
jgi:hypothetical protein